MVVKFFVFVFQIGECIVTSHFLNDSNSFDKSPCSVEIVIVSIVEKVAWILSRNGLNMFGICSVFLAGYVLTMVGWDLFISIFAFEVLMSILFVSSVPSYGSHCHWWHLVALVFLWRIVSRQFLC